MTQTLPVPVTAPFTKAQRAMIVNLVARAATAEIMPRFRKLDTGQIETKSHAQDLVTQADTATEAMIARGLQIAFPNALVIGEEAAEADPDYREKLSQAELGFVIDPVDGTWNFAHGVPVFGTIIAVCRFGRPVFGLIYDPVGKDHIWADIETRSTWVTEAGHAKPLRTLPPRPLSQMVGIVEMGGMPPQQKRQASLHCLELSDVVGLHCSAHHHRLLAQGAIDFILASQLKPWDHAAGVLICGQAGGRAAFLDGSDYVTSQAEGYLLSAASSDTWDRVAEVFAHLLPATTS